MSQDFGNRPSITTRPPATANLMIDSFDRPRDLSGSTPVFGRFPTPFDFQISKRESILNGFFTRIATSEVALEWNIPNVSPGLSNNTIVFDISASTYTTTIPQGFYTTEELILTIPPLMNATVGTGNGAINTFSTGVTGPVLGGQYFLTNLTPKQFQIQSGNLADTMWSQTTQATAASIKTYKPAIDLRPFRYIDFVSDDLTYNQNLKDNSTAQFPRDVLNRWYFDWDSQPDIDGFGYPIMMGQTPFNARRIYNPPKQIRWEPAQPLGNLKFQVYDDNGVLMTYLDTPLTAPTYNNGIDQTNWLMTLQVSEN